MQRSSICCPRCGAIESIFSERCHRCGNVLRQRVRRAYKLPALLVGDDAVTQVLIRLYAVIFVIVTGYALWLGGSPFEAINPGEAFETSLYRFGALFGGSVLAGQWWRFFTATFLHYGLLHLIFNCMSLNAVAPEAERNLSHLRSLVVFLVAGLIGNLGSFVWHVVILRNQFFQVGASGCICGMVGAMYMISRMRGGYYDLAVRRVVKSWILMLVVFGLFVPGVDNAAHFTGMAAGALLTRLIGLKKG